MAFNVHYDCNDGEKTGIATNYNDLRNSIRGDYFKIKLWGEIEGDIGFNDDDHDNGLFGYNINVEEIDLTGLNATNVTNLSCMFYECNRLTKIDFGDFDTSNVTDMSYMFDCCYDLQKINLVNFDTRRVTNMYSMFYDCISLQKIMVGDNWTTTNVNNSDYMFGECYELPNFDSDYIDKTYAYIGENGYLSPVSYEFLIQEQINYNGSNWNAYPKLKIGNSLYYDGNGALNSSNPTISITTQAIYDSIYKDATTLYFIKES